MALAFLLLPLFGARSMRRRDLIAALTCALPAHSSPVFDAELAGLDFDAAGNVASARLNIGDPLKSDLYVSAEGIRSRARHALYPGWPSAQAQVLEIAKQKMPDLNAASVEAAVKSIKGTARSMGIEVTA